MTAILLNEDFSSGVLPSTLVNTPANAWDVTDYGSLERQNFGLALGCQYQPMTNIDQQKWLVEFVPRTYNEKFAIYKQPFLRLIPNTDGTVCTVDMVLKRLDICGPWDGVNVATPPSVANLVLSVVKLVAGKRYRLEQIKAGRMTTFRITDVALNVSESLSLDNDAINSFGGAVTGTCGLSNGRPGHANLVGDSTVKLVQHTLPICAPTALFIGDSITVGVGTTYASCWARLSSLALAKSGNAWIDGVGGTNTANAMARYRYDMTYGKPPFVVLLVGHNDNTTDALAANYPTVVQSLHDLVIAQGSTPIVCAITPCQDPTKQARINTMNAFLMNQQANAGWIVPRFDKAITVGNDGMTYDPTLMHDADHPNTQGHALLAQQLQADCPQLFA